MALPRLGAKRVDPKETKVQDELEGLKTTMDNSLLTIEHSLEIKLIWDTMVRLFKSKHTLGGRRGRGGGGARFLRKKNIGRGTILESANTSRDFDLL